MASEHQRFNRATAKWDGLFDKHYFSVTADIGRVAIISSSFTDEPPDTKTGIAELANFQAEARDLADRITREGGKPELAIDASRGDITQLIQDPGVASVYVIGNGSLSSLMLDVRDYYDWWDVSEAATHLKLGRFVQRQCGGLTRHVNVPMGLFAVSDHTNVHAALDPAFYPQSLDDPVNAMVLPLFTTGRASYSDIKALGSVHNDSGG